MSKKLYSQLSMAVDLVSFEYQTSDPLIIEEKLQQDMGLNYTVHQIVDYLDINRHEDFENESKKIEYDFKNF